MVQLFEEQRRGRASGGQQIERNQGIGWCGIIDAKQRTEPNLTVGAVQERHRKSSRTTATKWLDERIEERIFYTRHASIHFRIPKIERPIYNTIVFISMGGSIGKGAGIVNPGRPGPDAHSVNRIASYRRRLKTVSATSLPGVSTIRVVA